MTWQLEYAAETNVSWLVVSGKKCGKPNGDVVVITPIKVPAEAKYLAISPNAADPHHRPEGLGRGHPNDTEAIFVFWNLVAGDYEFGVTDASSPKIVFKCKLEAEQKQETHSGQKPSLLAVPTIITPTANSQVQGTGFGSYGMSTHSIQSATIKVGAVTVNGTITQDNSPNGPWIVGFSGVPAGSGRITITNTNGESKSVDVTVL